MNTCCCYRPGSPARPVRGEHGGRHHRRLAHHHRAVGTTADGQALRHLRGGGHVWAAGRHRAQEVPHARRAQQRHQPCLRRGAIRLQEGKPSEHDVILEMTASGTQ